MDAQLLKNILEAGLLVAAKPLSVAQLDGLFADDKDKPNRADIKEALMALQAEYEGRGIELVEVASGFRLQSRDSMAHWMGRLFEERLPRYSRALLETLVLVAYRQPITRGEIEEIRGVAVSSNIVKTLLERQWVKEVGHKDVPGRPALLGTTKYFLDYFNLKRLDDLPPLGEIKDLDQIDAVLAESMGIESVDGASTEPAANDDIAVASSDVDIALDDSTAKTAPAEQVSTETGAPENVEEDLNSADVAEAADNAEQDALAAAADSEKESNSESAPLAAEELTDSDDDEDSSGPSDDSSGNPREPEVISEDELGFDETTAESELKRVIADFADEHQQELDAQRQLDAKQLSKPLKDSEQLQESDSDDAADESEAVLETSAVSEAESQESTGSAFRKSKGSDIADELPKPNDTLH